jgi:hypothetical protein
MPSKILDDLIVAGVPSDTIFAVKQLIDDAEKLAIRREKNRRYQQASRARKADMSARVSTRQHTSADSVKTLQIQRSCQHTSADSIVSPIEVSKKERKKDRACRLSADWKPSSADLEYANQRIRSPELVLVEVEKFKNHHIGKGTLMVVWSRAFQNWILNAVKWNTKPNGLVPGVVWHGTGGIV